MNPVNIPLLIGRVKPHRPFPIHRHTLHHLMPIRISSQQPIPRQSQARSVKHTTRLPHRKICPMILFLTPLPNNRNYSTTRTITIIIRISFQTPHHRQRVLLQQPPRPPIIITIIIIGAMSWKIQPLSGRPWSRPLIHRGKCPIPVQRRSLVKVQRHRVVLCLINWLPSSWRSRMCQLWSEGDTLMATRWKWKLSLQRLWPLS